MLYRVWRWLRDRAWILWCALGVGIAFYVLRKASGAHAKRVALERLTGRLEASRDLYRSIHREAEELDGVYAETTLHAHEEASEYQRIIEALEEQYREDEERMVEHDDEVEDEVERVRSATGFGDFSYKGDL